MELVLQLFLGLKRQYRLTRDYLQANKKARSIYSKLFCTKGLDFLFKTPISNDDYLIIHEGEVDEDEYISWKPIEMTVSLDFTRLENEFDINLHKSIVDYFNSYWFADLDGFLKEYYITLEPVLPNSEISSFQASLKGYKKNHWERLEKIPIGIEANGLLVVIDNIKGTVHLEDFERGTFDYISENVQALIGNLRLKNNTL